MEGEGTWTAIRELRNGYTQHERELGALNEVTKDVKADVDSLGEETRKTRHELRNQITATEGRLMVELKSEVATLAKANNDRASATDARLERMTANWRLALVVAAPAATTILGIVIGRAG